MYSALAGAVMYEENLKRVDPEAKASGVVTLKHYGFVTSDRILEVTIFGLKPRAVYTVWLLDTNTGKRTPAGLTGKNRFRASADGVAHYSAFTDEYTTGWKTLQIAYHADGNAENTGGMVVVLTAKLRP